MPEAKTSVSAPSCPGASSSPMAPLQQGPGRVLVAAVGVGAGGVAGQVVVGGEDRTGQGRLVLDRLGQPGPHRARAVAQTGFAGTSDVFIAGSLMPPVPPIPPYRGEQTGARRLDHPKALLEAVPTPVVRIRDVEVGACGGIVRTQQTYLLRVLRSRRQAAQGLQVACVEGDDEVEAGEPRGPELAGRVAPLVTEPPPGRRRCAGRRRRPRASRRCRRCRPRPGRQPGLRHVCAEDGLGHRGAADVAGADETDAVGHRALSPGREGRCAAPRRRSEMIRPPRTAVQKPSTWKLRSSLSASQEVSSSISALTTRVNRPSVRTNSGKGAASRAA